MVHIKMEKNIDTIFEEMNWNKSEDIQMQAIEQAKKIKHLSVFIMPIENKSVWENCAKVLISKSDDELSLYFIELFKWFKDMNWPGAYLIYDRLLNVSKEEILVECNYSISVARKLKDYAWERALLDFYKQYIDCFN